MLRGHIFFYLNDKRSDGGGLGAVGKEPEKFFVKGDRVGVLFLTFVDEAQKLIDYDCVGSSGKLLDRGF